MVYQVMKQMKEPDEEIHHVGHEYENPSNSGTSRIKSENSKQRN